jgi:hypothetical protein
MVPKAMRARDRARRFDIKRAPPPRVLAARAVAARQQQPLRNVAAIAEAERLRRLVSPTPPEVQFDFARLRTDSDAVISGQPLEDMLSGAQERRHGGMDSAALARSMGEYPHLDQLLLVAQGAQFPLKEGFKAQHKVKFQQNYLRNRPFVNAAVAEDHECGRCVLLTEEAALALIEAGYVIHISPSGAVWSSFEQKLRATHNMSAGDGGEYEGSLNDFVDKEALLRHFGKCPMEDGAVLAGVVCAAHDAEPDMAAPIYTADAKGAFKQVSLAPESAALSCTAVLVTNEHGEDETLIAMATVGTFGGAAMPDIWGAAMKAACWIADTQPVDWYVKGFDKFVARPAAPTPPPSEAKKSAAWVDDHAGARAGLRASMLQCASFGRALEFVFAPSDSLFATAASAPASAISEHKDLPPWLLEFDWKVVSKSKLFPPNGDEREFSGWSFSEELESVSLSDRGWRRVVSLLWLDIPETAETVPRHVLEKAASALWYYAQGSSVLPAYVGELRRLVKQFKNHNDEVPLSALARSDLAVWRLVILAAARRPMLVSFCMRDLACVLRPLFYIKGDSSFAGAGAWLRMGEQPEFDEDVATDLQGGALVAFKLRWTVAERQAAARLMLTEGDINVMECAVLILSVATFGPSLEGQTGSYAGDNSSSLAWCKLRRAKGSRVGSGLVKILCLLLVRFRIRLRFDFCMGRLNQIADALSRLDTHRSELRRLTGARPFSVRPVDAAVRHTVTQVLTGVPEERWLPLFKAELLG